MKNKRLLVSVITTILCFALLTPSAWAGKKHRYRLEGIAIGLGAAILGSALYQRGHRHYRPAPAPAPAPAPELDYQRPRTPRFRGHWKAREIWVPPTHKKVWNPGHYDRRSNWVQGRWISVLVEPGYWVKKRVWGRRHQDRRHKDRFLMAR